VVLTSIVGMSRYKDMKVIGKHIGKKGALHPLRMLALLVASSLLIGCAVPARNLVELTLPPQRIQMQGYSFMPLDEPGWLMAQRADSRIALVRYGASQDETYVIQGGLLPLAPFASRADFARAVLAAQKADINPGRFKPSRHEVVAVDGYPADCVRSYAAAEDMHPQRRDGRSGSMILRIATLICMHPRSNGVAITVSYSHRHNPGEDDPLFEERATNVISSVRFTGS